MDIPEKSPKERIYAVLDHFGRKLKLDLRYIARGAFWGNLNYFVLSLLAFVTSLLFARLLTKDEYGTYQYVLAIAGLISGTTLNGMCTAVNRAVARGYEGELRRSVKYQLLLGIIPTSIALGFAVWNLSENQTGLALAFLWVALFLPAANAFATWADFMGGKKLWRASTYFGLLNSVISYAGVILMICFTRNFVWIALGNFGFGFLGNVILYNVVLKKYKPNDKTEEGTLAYGTHLSIMGIPGVISGQLDALLVYQFVGPAALAVYTFATLIPEKIAGTIKFIQSIALPRFAEKDEMTVKNFLAKKLPLVFMLLGAVAAAYALVAPLIFRVFFPSYSASIPFTQVYSLSFFSIAGGLVQAGLTSQKKTRALYISSFIMPPLQATLLFVLIYFFGVWGVLWAQIIVNIIQVPIQMSFLGKKHV